MDLPRFHPVSPDYRFAHDRTNVVPPAALSAAMQDALAGKGLFDGQILVAREIGTSGLHASTARYSHYLAARGSDSDDRLLALAVTGIARVGDQIVLGRRGSGVSQEAGLLEFAPSGGIESSRVRPDGTIDVAAQLLDELTEELGALPGSATVGAPLGLVIDEAEYVIDIICPVRLDAAANELLDWHGARASDEYSELVFKDLAELGKWKLWPEPVGRATDAVLAAMAAGISLNLL